MQLTLGKKDSVIYLFILSFIVIGSWHMLAQGIHLFWILSLSLLMLFLLVYSWHLVRIDRKLRSESRPDDHGIEEPVYTNEVEKAFFDISSILVFSEDIDDMIRQSLERLALIHHADIASFYKVVRNDGSKAILHQWYSPKGLYLPDEKGSMEEIQFKWLLSRLADERTVIVACIDDLPAQAFPERAFMKYMQLRSLMAYPVITSGELSCFIVLGYRDEGHKAGNEIKGMLDMFSSFLGIAFEKKQALESLKRNRAQLEHQLEFESLISEISTKLLSLKAEELDRGIDLALMKIGEFAGVDRSYVFQFSDGKSLMHNTHEWCASGVKPEKDNLQNMSTADAPSLVRDLSAFKPVHISSVSSMTPEHTQSEKDVLESQGIKSLILVPMVIDNDLLGYIGFDSVKEEKRWSDESVRLLKVLAQMFASALQEKTAVESLNTERDQLLSIFDSMEELVYVSDPVTYEILYVNKQLREKLGTDPVGDMCYKVFQGMESPCDFCTNPVILRKRNESCVWEHYNDSDKRNYSVTDRIIKWPDGRDVRLELARDITAVREAEKDARKSEEKFRKTVENSPMPIAIVSLEGLIEYGNKRFIEAFGYTKEDVASISDWWLHAYPDKVCRENWHEEWQRILNSNDAGVVRNSDVVCKDGTVRNIDFHFARTSGEVIIVAHDLTDRKKFEDALLLEEARLEALQQLNQMTELSVSEIEDFALEEGIRLTGSKTGYIGFLSEDSRSLIMHTWSENVIIECNMDSSNTEFRLSESGLWADAIRQLRPVIINDYDAPHSRKTGYPEGHICIERYMAVPIVDGNKVVGLAGVANKTCDYDQADARQLTLLMHGMWRLIQRRNAESALRNYASRLSEANTELSKLNEELKSLDELKNNFLCNISHELKTPLIPILGFGELIADGTLGPLNNEQKKAMETVMHSSGQLKRLIESLIFMSSLEARQFAYDMNPVHLEPIIEKAIVIISLENRDKKVVLNKDIPSDLSIIKGDTDYLSQLFMHLVDNAFKFTPSGGRVSVSAWNENGSVHLTVEDTGIGIPANKIMKAFDSFYQIDGSRSRRYGGTGIGLSMCKKIAEDHGGRLWIESEENVGTKVHISFPALL